MIKATVAELQRAMQDGHYVFIVTGRAIAKPVEEFLTDEIGSHPPVIATAGSEGKTPWLKNQLNKEEYQRVVVYEDCKKNIRALKDVTEAAGVTYSAMCILEDQSMVKAESRWRREDLLNELDFREMTRNFLRKTW